MLKKPINKTTPHKKQKTPPSKTAAARTALDPEHERLESLEKLLVLIQKHQVVEFEWNYQNHPLKVKIHAHPAPSTFPPNTVLSSPAPLLPAPVNPSIHTTVLSTPSSSSTKQITSPLVGTFYRATSPEATPYVQEGQVIKRGDVLCIIEAMKLMNEIEAEYSGKIIAVLVENGQPVEFGEPLFTIET